MKKILIANNSPITQRLLMRSLAKKGYEVSIINNGLEALRELEKKHYDMLLLDLVMPGMGGVKLLEAINELKNDLVIENLVIIVITANPGGEIKETTKRMGCFDYITKPIDMNYLHSAIERAFMMGKETYGERTQKDYIKAADIQTVNLGDTFSDVAEKIGEPHQVFSKKLTYDGREKVMWMYKTVIKSSDIFQEETDQTQKLVGPVYFITFIDRKVTDIRVKQKI